MTAVIVPGEKQEPPGPYSIGFENILVAKARVNQGLFSMLQGGFLLYLLGLSMGLLIFATENNIRGCFRWLKNR